MLGLVETRSVSPVFVGRTDELDTLNDALARAAAGEPQALLLGGEAGRRQDPAGRGVRHRGLPARAPSSRSAAASRSAPTDCPSPPSPPPCAPCAAQLPDELAAAAAGQEEELARLLPELGEAPPAGGPAGTTRRAWPASSNSPPASWSASPPTAPSSSPWRTCTGPTPPPATSSPTSSAPCAPAASSSSPPTAPTTSTAATRCAPCSPNSTGCAPSAASNWAASTGTRSAARSPASSPPNPTRPRSTTIFERSDGNAFFVEELAVAAHEGCCTGLTDSLRDLLLVRVEALPESAQRVARIVAEGGSTVEYRLLAAVARLAEDDLIEALRAAVGRQHPAAPRPTATATASATPWSARPSATTCCPANAPASTAATPRPWRPTPRSSPPTSASCAWPATGTTPTTPPRPCPPSCDASVAARRRHAYSEQLRLLERAMELWDTAPEDIRAELRPVDYTEVYPPCGCDPATTPLRYLDLMAEAAVAGRLCGERRTRPEDHQARAAAAGGRGRPAARRLVLGPALPAGRRPWPAATAGRNSPPPRSSCAACRPPRCTPRCSPPSPTGRMLHDPGPDALVGRRTRRRVRAHGRRPRDRAQRPPHPRRPHGRRRRRRGRASRRCTRSGTARLADGVSSPSPAGPTSICPPRSKRVGRSREAVPLLRGGHRATPGSSVCWTPRPGSGPTSPSRCTPWAAGTRPPKPPPAPCAWALSAKPRGGARRAAAPHSPSAAATCPRPPANWPPPAATSARHDPMPQHTFLLSRIDDRRRRRRGPAPRRPRRTRTRPGRRLPARHPALRLAPAPRRRHRRGRRPRPARRRARAAPRSSNASARPPGSPRHRRPRLAGPRAVGARRTHSAPRAATAPTTWSRGGHRLRTPWTAPTTSPASATAWPRPSCDAPAATDDRDRAAELLRLAHAVADHLGARPLADAVALLAQRARLTLNGPRVTGARRAPPTPPRPSASPAGNATSCAWSPPAAPTAR